METFRNEEFLWIEKYRPQKIDDCILPQQQLETFKEYLNKGEIQNLLLCGGAGMGKTTVARALCEELGTDYIMINGSEESGIDVLRTKIKQFASTVSLTGKVKVVILDEADYLQATSTQPALRSFMEEFSQNCRFILTCNFKNRLIPPLHSRCTVIEFKITKEDRPKIASKFMKRIKFILEQENIPFDEKVVASLLMKFFPDYRRILNELQKYSVSGRIDEGILSSVEDANTKELIKYLKEKEWGKMRQWVVSNIDNDPATLYRKLYDDLLDKVNEVPQLVLILADYGYKSSFCADQEINLVACLTEIMASVTFKG
jgi:DNA polymerase III delta prime subunit